MPIYGLIPYPYSLAIRPFILIDVKRVIGKQIFIAGKQYLKKMQKRLLWEVFFLSWGKVLNFFSVISQIVSYINNDDK